MINSKTISDTALLKIGNIEHPVQNNSNLSANDDSACGDSCTTTDAGCFSVC